MGKADASTKDYSRVMEFQREAEKYLPGGVAGSGRYNPSLGYSLFLQRAEGSRIYDLDGKEYIDFNLSHGAAFLGHNHPAIRQAVEQTFEIGLLAGYETEQTTELAKTITEIIPCAEMMRMANSGTEGTMLTLRLARAFTGKKKIVKFWGHFHGLHDYVMYNAHSPLTPVKSGELVPLNRDSAGIPDEMDTLIYVVPWKDEEALEKLLRQHGHEIAAIIMEPINYNSGCIIASQEYMEFARKLATEHNIVLIYDEVLSAFRTGASCAQGYYGITPDLCVISKAVANGIPTAIVAGKKEIMSLATPIGEVTHSGTYCGNLLSVMAAKACLKEITGDGFYEHIYAVANQLYEGLSEVFERNGVPARVQGLGARFGIFFGFTEEVKDFSDTLKNDNEMAAEFLRACAKYGVYFHSYGNLAGGHHGFSASHSLDDINEALNRIENALQDMS
jgi:glutamate-1-semialdehyde 2,1-aminomutase